MINHIKHILSQPGGCPTWDASRIIDASGAIADPLYVKEIQEWVLSSAREAGLPLLSRPNPVREAGGKLADIAKDSLLGVVEETLDRTIGLPIKLTKILGGVVAPEAIAKVETMTEIKSRQVQSWLFHASLDYGPLIPSPKF